MWDLNVSVLNHCLSFDFAVIFAAITALELTQLNRVWYIYILCEIYFYVRLLACYNQTLGRDFTMMIKATNSIQKT